MVKVQPALPVDAQGKVDVAAWTERMQQAYPRLDAAKLGEIAGAVTAELLPFAMEYAHLCAELNLDADCVYTALAYRDLRRGGDHASALETRLSAEGQRLARSVAAMADVSLLEMSSGALQATEQESQVENVRRMLVSLIDDPRVAVLKIAERVIAMRQAKRYDRDRRLRLAQEAMYVFAPLAGRLGIAQLKWELEDLALRYTEEDTYKSIARKLAAKRTHREQQMRIIEDRVRTLLRANGLNVEIYGRAKHIFSIWRKMQTKRVNFDQVYDVRAIRIVTKSLAECYACLGVIHARWPHVPSEFDDYIANPKENGYQSIHTAVTMEEAQTVEIQIRTAEMHEDAELGVCAHWSYKGESGPDRGEDFQDKMDWLRQVLEWHEDLGGKEDLGTLLRHGASPARIYVSTPKGHVLDLPRGATVLDFAYRVHTDVGHACRDALVDGKQARLGQILGNSQTVTITTEKGGLPMRDWLEPGYGFVCTDRARAKLVRYFRGLRKQERLNLGRSMVEEALRILGLPAITPDDKELIALGGGLMDLVPLLTQKLADAADQLALPGIGEEPQRVVGLYVRGQNRDGLLLDITQVLTNLNHPLSATTGTTSADGREAVINIETEVATWQDSLKLAANLKMIKGVEEIGRWARERV